jgi:hypothetical protein
LLKIYEQKKVDAIYLITCIATSGPNSLPNSFVNVINNLSYVLFWNTISYFFNFDAQFGLIFYYKIFGLFLNIGQKYNFLARLAQ